MAEIDGTHSQTPIPLVSSVDERYLPRFLPPLALEDNRSSEIKRNSKRKLEDYLDPVLLHTISSRIGRSETKVKQQMEMKVVFVNTNQRSEFDWPNDRLDPLSNDPNRFTEEDEARLFPPIRSSLNKRRRSNFPIWTVDGGRWTVDYSNNGAAT